MIIIILILILILIYGCIFIIKNNYDWYKGILFKCYHKIKPYLTWRILLCFGMAWMITNGWCYIFIFFGSLFHLNWMRNIGLGYLAFLWLPCTPEKLITIPIAIWFHKRLFPKHSTEFLESKLKEEREASPKRSKNK